MREPQDNHRTEAARAFVESLDQLQNLLGNESLYLQSKSHPATSKSSSLDDKVFDLTLLEEVAADLEQFFGDTQPLDED